MFAKDLGWTVPGKSLCPAHSTREFGEHPPIWARHTWRRAKWSWPGDAPFGVGYRAILLTPARRWQHHLCEGRGICGPAVGHHDKRTLAQCLSHAIGTWHRRNRIGGRDPQRFHLAVSDGMEQIDRRQTWSRRQLWRLPERAQ